MKNLDINDKNVDERLAEFDRELNRIDTLLEDQKETVKSNVKGFEQDFSKFMHDMGIDYTGMKDNFNSEMDRIGKDLEGSTKHITDTLENLTNQFIDRDKK